MTIKGGPNLKKNWLVVWKLIWGIWPIFTAALESLKIGISMGSFNPMMQNLKRNWLVILTFTWGIWRILTRALESLKHFHFNILLLRKVYMLELKKYRGIIFHETERDTKFGEESTCCFKIGIINLTYFDLTTQKSQRFSL